MVIAGNPTALMNTVGTWAWNVTREVSVEPVLVTVGVTLRVEAL